MDLGIEGRVAVVAASSRGLGRAVAEALAAEGVKLALCARTEDVLKDTASRIRDRWKVPVLEQPLDGKTRRAGWPSSMWRRSAVGSRALRNTTSRSD